MSTQVDGALGWTVLSHTAMAPVDLDEPHCLLILAEGFCFPRQWLSHSCHAGQVWIPSSGVCRYGVRPENLHVQQCPQMMTLSLWSEDCSWRTALYSFALCPLRIRLSAQAPRKGQVRVALMVTSGRSSYSCGPGPKGRRKLTQRRADTMSSLQLITKIKGSKLGRAPQFRFQHGKKEVNPWKKSPEL